MQSVPERGLERGQQVIDLWKTKDAPNAVYYEQAEDPAWIAGFWAENGIFVRRFVKLDLTNVLEIACGKGRHAARCIDRCGHITLFDTSVEGIEACKQRFADRTNVSYMLSSSGRDLAEIADGTLTAVYSYDSMVHFEMEFVFAYLDEIYRVLRPGGRALLHHSVYDKAPGRPIFDNAAWRNFMNEATFRHVALRRGFVIEEMETFKWTTPDVTDALTLLLKPEAAPEAIEPAADAEMAPAAEAAPDAQPAPDTSPTDAKAV